VRTHTDADGYTTTIYYDVFDRVTRVTYPDGTYEAYTYDRLDLAPKRDRLGRITRVYHDALRRTVAALVMFQFSADPMITPPAHRS
jgi:YD repeat-containing protein